MEQLSNIDVIISLVFVLSIVVAFIRGFVKEVLSIIGLFLFVYRLNQETKVILFNLWRCLL